MNTKEKIAQKEKNSVAFLSVIAAVFITFFKFIVGIATGSLGILSEALHSGLDMVAALITLIAVRVSGKPADDDHHYGHGKVENFSALIETFLLLVTCTWIIYEAIHRLTTGKVEIEVTAWSYIVIVTSIIIDISRSRALSKAAKKYNSQALEADALHFSTDVWSSLVVLFGLIAANFGYFYADSVAALIVAGIVIYVSYKLGKRAVDVLLDKSPDSILPKINEVVKSISEVIHYHDIKIRTSGAETFIEMNIHVKPDMSIEDAHRIAHKVEAEICRKIEKCNVHIHLEPEGIE